MGLLNALFDPQFRGDVKRGLLDSANRGVIGGILGGPVDLATMAMRPLGYNIEKPMGGSEWIGDKLQERGFVSGNRNALAEALAGAAIPFAMPMAVRAIQATKGMPVGMGIKDVSASGLLGDSTITPKHSPEQLAKWAREKAERDAQKTNSAKLEWDYLRGAKQRQIEAFDQHPFSANFDDSQKDLIKNYLQSGDFKGAQAEKKAQAVESIRRYLESSGIPINSISRKGGGTSIYPQINGQIVRVSDHELPMTPERMTNRENGLLGKWDREVLVNNVDTPFDDYIQSIKGFFK